ncbi:MAG: hypothetical protein KatS3mg105_0777 [Gemmatales bacterium]|nr:MAG: hypothetical protein KatS3mg105_0777 [Gemmatales bacterium]
MLGPIFNREWLTVPRRTGHYVVRSSYLAFLWILGLTAWQSTVGWERPATIGDHARFSLFLFHGLTVLQLILIPFFSALAAASAVSREKDRRTFVLLLLTDLRSHEIVLGKLFGSLLPVVLLLFGTLPIMSLLLLLGGIAFHQVLFAGLVVLAAALAAGSLGNFMALWREKTFQVLALTLLAIIVYLGAIRLLFLVVPTPYQRWLDWFDPFETLSNVLDASTGATGVLGFLAIMLGLMTALNGWAIHRLRVWNPSGEPIVQREQPEATEEVDRLKAHAAPGRVREVWSNPILWREIRTRAYGRRPILVKTAYFAAVALICLYVLAPAQPESGTPFLAAYGLVPVAIISFLLIGAQAVTSITSERDSGALNLLLVTDLTPQEFIFGKLGGIAWNSKEYLIPPLVLTIVYAAMGLLATPPANHPELAPGKNWEAATCIITGTLLLAAFVAVLGVHVALRNENSRTAIIHTLATVFFLSVGTLVCVYLILINGRFEAQWTSFILFAFAGVGGMWWVLNGNRPTNALVLASWLCPTSILYTVINILVAKPGTRESTDPLIPFLFVSGAFGFTIAAMLVPLLSEFDVALGRTRAAE